MCVHVARASHRADAASSWRRRSRQQTGQLPEARAPTFEDCCPLWPSSSAPCRDLACPGAGVHSHGCESVRSLLLPLPHVANYLSWAPWPPPPGTGSSLCPVLSPSPGTSAPPSPPYNAAPACSLHCHLSEDTRASQWSGSPPSTPAEQPQLLRTVRPAHAHYPKPQGPHSLLLRACCGAAPCGPQTRRPVLLAPACQAHTTGMLSHVGPCLMPMMPAGPDGGWGVRQCHMSPQGWHGNDLRHMCKPHAPRLQHVPPAGRCSPGVTGSGRVFTSRGHCGILLRSQPSCRCWLSLWCVP